MKILNTESPTMDYISPELSEGKKKEDPVLGEGRKLAVVKSTNSQQIKNDKKFIYKTLSEL